jgi:Caspase domain/N-acetylmuramoyl-L-alanine amidase
MPPPFFPITLAQFYLLLDCYPLTRIIDSVHMHHTWAPNRAQYKGEDTINAIYKAHLARGLRDIAEHITIAPDGTIWSGRDLNLPPASAVHFNGTDQSGPFMFGTVGDFDLGHDPFDGVQKDTVYRILVGLLKRFNLPPEQIKFHNQMTSLKTCPGTSIDRANLIREVAALLNAPKDDPVTSDGVPAATSVGTADAAYITRVITAMTRPLPVGRELASELMYDFAAQRSFETYSSPEAELLDFGTRDVADNSSPSTADLETLRPYTINMRWGKFADTDGHLLQTTPGDVDAIVQQYLPQEINTLAGGEFLDILLYAHGGLVSESDALGEALTALPFFRNNKVYPIFFVWETDLWVTIQGLVTGQTEAQTRDLIGVADAVRDKAIEFAAHYVLQGPTLWGGMKGDAAESSAPDGAAYYFAKGLAKFIADLGPDAARVRLHAVGHSAGAIFHSYLLPVLFSMNDVSITTMHLLAPAIRIDAYKARLAALVGNRIKDVTMYTMVKPRELADTCKKIYGHSLLYLIRNALEDVIPTPILGLEESIRADQAVATQFGLSGGPPDARIIWSPTKAGTGVDASQSICHGGFHNDPATMGSLVRRVKQWPASQEIDNFPNLGNICPDAGTPRRISISPSLPQSSALAPTPYAVQSTLTRSTTIRTGKRVALCIGIDQYLAPNTLTGCVADALAWQGALANLGFSVTTLLDGDASFDAMVRALTDLVSGGQPGDTLLLQYSGHGTEVPNPDRQAGDGELAAEDEAFVPVDFMQQGGFLIDRQVRSIFDKLAVGAQLTCFIDCCHSATISRMMIGGAPSPAGSSVHARFIPFNAAMARAYQDFQSRTVSSSIYPPGLRSEMRHVVFSACRADEVAYERNGRGDFSRLTIPLLNLSLSNFDFAARINQAFGPTPAQHPVLDCADPWMSLPLFSFSSATAPSGNPSSANATRQLDLEALSKQLRGLADLIGS